MDGGIEVVESNRFEQLVRALTERIDAGSGAGVLSFADPVELIVPTLDHGDYTRLALARERGAISNLQVSRLQGYVSDVLFAGRDGEDLLTRAVLNPLVLDALGGVEDSSDPEFDPLQDYLEVEADAADDEPDPVERRRYVLARRVAGYLEEYTFSRPELIEAWNTDDDWPYDTDEPTHVGWQRRLWRELTNEVGAVEADETTYYTLKDGLERRRGQMAEAVTSERPLQLFGFANIGEVFLDVLEEVAEHRPVCLYRLNSAPREETDGDAWFHRVLAEDHAGNVHAALDRWGRIGAEAALEQRDRAVDVERVLGEPETVDSWLSSTQCQIAVPPGTDELAEADTVFDGATRLSEEALKFDGSIRALACPNVRREIEVVANDIWKRVGHGDVGAFSDIAIAVPRTEEKRYYAQIQAVFETFEQLPYTLNSAPLSSESRVFEAFELLLELPYGDFRRDEVLPFLTHPNVAGRYADTDPNQWAEWVQTLGIYHGADHADHEETYIDQDLFNWEQGLRRLALGHYLTSPDVSAGERIEIETDDGGRTYLPESIDPSKDADAAAFDELTSALIEDVRWLRRHEAPLDEWAEIFQSFVDTYLHPARGEDADWEADRKEMERLKTAFETLAEAPEAGRTWNYDQASLFARDALEGLTRTTPHAFTEGVVVAPPSELRGLPFDHLYMVGMGAGQFPARTSENTLDLRRAQRQPGDVLPDERDQYHFLELLLSARDGFHVSWVARDSTTGEEIAPSSVVSDLKRFLNVESEPEDLFGDAMTTVFPLRRFDRHGEAFQGLGGEHDLPADERPANEDVTDERGRMYHPAAFREAQMDAVREVLEAEFGDQAGDIELEELFHQIQQEVDAETTRIRIQTPRRDREESEVRRMRLRHSVLVNFLKSPLQTTAKRAHGLWTEEDDPRSELREPFDVGQPETTVVPRDVMQTALAQALPTVNLEELYRKAVAPRKQSGSWPLSPFREQVEQTLWDRLEAWRDNYADVYCKGAKREHLDWPVDEPLIFAEFGRTSSRRRSTGSRVEHAETVEVTLEPSTEEPSYVIQLYGRTRAMTPDREAIVNPVKGNRQFKNSIRPYIDHLVMSAARETWAETTRTCVLLRPSDSEPQQCTAAPYEFPALSREQAHAHLERLLATIFIDPENYLFPYPAIDPAVDSEEPSGPSAIREKLERIDKWGTLYSEFGPLSDYMAYSVPPDPRRVARERFRHHPAIHNDQGEDHTR